MEEAITEAKKNKLARVMVGPHPVPSYVIVGLLNKLPPDTILVDIYKHQETLQFGLVFSSEKFAEVKEAGEIPKIILKADLVTKTVDVHVPSPVGNFLDELESL